MNNGYDTKLFCEIYPDEASFLTDYLGNKFPKDITNDNISVIFYLLYAKYGNTPIANFDVNQFKYKLFSVIFMYGPRWQKQLAIQQEIRALNIDDVMKGNKTIWNKALNPNTEPSTAALEEVREINEQNVQTQKKSIADSYALLLGLLEDTFTEEFIDRFKICFKSFVMHERPILYISED